MNSYILFCSEEEICLVLWLCPTYIYTHYILTNKRWKSTTFSAPVVTGYQRSVTGCGSQRSHVVVAQWKLKCINCKQRDPHIIIIEFDFDENHIHLKWSSFSTTHLLLYMFLIEVKFNFEDEDHAIYISYRWVTTIWLCWPVIVYTSWA